MKRHLSVLLVAGLFFGCGDDDAPVDQGVDMGVDQSADMTVDAVVDDADAMAPDAGPSQTRIGSDERPAQLVVPASYEEGTAIPLLVMLHGYSVDGRAQDVLFQTARAARRKGFIAIIPNGTVDGRGNPFWNATESCCDFFGTNVDDVGYLNSLIEEAKSRFTIDDQKVFFIGHSNGGFMSYRIACELSDTVTGIVSLAGATWMDPANCPQEKPVSVLQIHGTLDATIAASFGKMSLERTAELAGCDLSMNTTSSIENFSPSFPVSSTAYEAGCEQDANYTYWAIEGAGHIPALTDFTDVVYEWLLENHRP